MAERVETPPSLRGTAEQQLQQLYSYLFRFAERLNVILDSLSGTSVGSYSGADDLSVGRYKELREMMAKGSLLQGESLGAESKRLERLINERVTQEQLTEAVEAALRVAEESGAFDGNGIASASMANSILTLLFTDGTKFTSPSLRGAQGPAGENFQFAVGDVYSTTLSGDPASLLGYGTWTQVATSPVNMWKRTA